jgi:RNA polymerase sigma factor (sigma-70 family)
MGGSLLMTEMTEAQKLLAEYATQRSEQAFRELVSRYIGLVSSTALRLLGGDTHSAEDVAQIVFFDLARSARTLSKDVMLGGWLHRHTCFVVSKTLRSERRRRLREEHASDMKSLHEDSTRSLAEFEPFLDQVIEQLGERDRIAILLRFFEQLDFASIGKELGSNEAAAQKRVERALERLHRLLKQKGCTLSLAAVGTTLGSQSLSAAPVPVAAAIASAALAGTTATTTANLATFNALTMTTLQKGIVAAAVGLAVTTGVYEIHRASRLGDLLQTLEQRDKPLLSQLEQFRRERDDATNRLAAATDQLQAAERQAVELAKLRGEVARLRLETQELAKFRPATSKGSEVDIDERWLGRVRLLKRRVTDTPSAHLPEFRFLEEDDWLMAAKRQLETDDDFRAAISDLQGRGEGNFLRIVERALRKFLDANNNQFPATVSALKPFLDPAADDEMLNQYQIVPSSELPQGNLGGATNEFYITPKSPAPGGALWALGRSGLSGMHNSAAMDVLAPAVKALLEAAPLVNGKKEANIHDLPPYLTTPEQRAAYQQLIQNSR